MAPLAPRASGTPLVSVLLSLLAVAGCALVRQERLQAYRRVLPPVAFEMLRDTPDLLVLDLRQPGEFRGSFGHIYHSRNLPLEQLPFRLAELSGYRDRTLLVYCRKDDECGATGMAILASSGFDNAVLIDGGIEGWVADGFGTVGELESPESDQLTTAEEAGDKGEQR